MAPTKVKAGSAKGQNKKNTKPSGSGSSSKGKAASRSSAPKSAKSKVSKPQSSAAHKAKKRRHYTEKELNIQKLNMITPAGVIKPKGKKKGKVFVDDQESLMTILAMVNADKEGQIESKMLRARQLEEVRQARIRETEARAESKKQKLVSLNLGRDLHISSVYSADRTSFNRKMSKTSSVRESPEGLRNPARRVLPRPPRPISQAKSASLLVAEAG